MQNTITITQKRIDEIKPRFSFKGFLKGMFKELDKLVPSCHTTMRELQFNPETEKFEWVITFSGSQENYLNTKRSV